MAMRQRGDLCLVVLTGSYQTSHINLDKRLYVIWMLLLTEYNVAEYRGPHTIWKHDMEAGQ
jgi:hypothetical protein